MTCTTIDAQTTVCVGDAPLPPTGIEHPVPFVAGVILLMGFLAHLAGRWLHRAEAGEQLQAVPKESRDAIREILRNNEH